MPKLALRLHIGWLEGRVRERCLVVFRVRQKSQLRGHAEVGHGEVADLFQDGIATQLQINLLRRVQVVDSQRRDLHDVADIEQVQPLTLIQVAEEHLHVDYVLQAFEFVSSFLALLSGRF